MISGLIILAVFECNCWVCLNIWYSMYVLNIKVHLIYYARDFDSEVGYTPPHVNELGPVHVTGKLQLCSLYVYILTSAVCIAHTREFCFSGDFSVSFQIANASLASAFTSQLKFNFLVPWEVCTQSGDYCLRSRLLPMMVVELFIICLFIFSSVPICYLLLDFDWLTTKLIVCF